MHKKINSISRLHEDWKNTALKINLFLTNYKVGDVYDLILKTF